MRPWPRTDPSVRRFGTLDRMGKRTGQLDPVADLKRRLGRAATDRARAFWARYLRGAAQFRGVTMAAVREHVHRWWSDHGLGEHPATVGKRIALALIEQPMTEDKLAGILVLQELLGDQLRAGDLPAFARLFAAGHLADFHLADWFSMKVLVTLVERAPGRADTARALAEWRLADTTWQRGAACLAFKKLALHGDREHPGLTELVLRVCATVVWSSERFDQTAVGWVLRELSRAEPARVEAFYRRHAQLMSKECARHAVAKFPAAQRAELLAHHRRATSLRRA
jgi:3-methyladenine DNA glycosylase AlkD